MARAGWNLEKLRERARESLEQAGEFEPECFAKLSAQLRYVDGDYADPATYHKLRKELGLASRPIHYLAIPPSMFASVVQGLAKSGCADNARVIVEKPFGRDLATAQALDATLHEVFPEESIFRIDHYLGKEAVQNLLYFRFANTFPRADLEPRVRQGRADHHGRVVRRAGPRRLLRGSRRDPRRRSESSAAGDLAAGHGPAGGPRARRRGRRRNCGCFARCGRSTRKEVVRGQFRGYRAEKGVAPDSQVETFAALRLHIDTWRWAGVPFYIRTGKCLPVTATEVMVTLKGPPLAVFDASDTMPCNYFRLRLSPEVVIGTGALVKRSGEEMRGEPVELIARHHSQSEKSPYERLLGDAVRGDTSLFTQDDIASRPHGASSIRCCTTRCRWCSTSPAAGGPRPRRV